MKERSPRYSDGVDRELGRGAKRVTVQQPKGCAVSRRLAQVYEAYVLFVTFQEVVASDQIWQVTDFQT